MHEQKIRKQKAEFWLADDEILKFKEQRQYELVDGCEDKKRNWCARIENMEK